MTAGVTTLTDSSPARGELTGQAGDVRFTTTLGTTRAEDVVDQITIAYEIFVPPAEATKHSARIDALVFEGSETETGPAYV